MSFVDWVFDVSEEIIDLYFIMSDLVDVNLTEAQRCESAHCDSMASATVRDHAEERHIPIGKRVL